MQVIKSFFISLLLLIPFTKSYASNLKDTMSVGFDTYSDSGNVEVYSPTFSLMKTLSNQFLLGFKVRIDSITAASIKKLSATNAPVATTATASTQGEKEGPDDVRFSPTFFATYDNGADSVTGGFYLSSEKDYQGKSIFANYVRQLNQDNTALGIGISQSFDAWNPAIPRTMTTKDRKESKVDLSVNQLITPKLSMQLVYSYLYSAGFLPSPYNYLVIGGTNVYEKYPEKRTGNAYALKGVALINESNSINMSYRYYKDSWDIASHTISTEWLTDISKNITTGLRARYYVQTKANFTKPLGSALATDTYIVSDYRASAFDTVDVGIPFIYKPSVGSNIKFSASIDYDQTSSNKYIKNWYNTDSLNAIYTTLRIDYDF